MPVTQGTKQSTTSRDSIAGYGDKTGALASLARRVAQISNTTSDNTELSAMIQRGDAAVYDALEQLVQQNIAQIWSKFCCVGSDMFVSANTAQTNMDVLASSSTTILWDTRTATNGGMPYNATTGRWTPTQSGYYKVFAYFNDMHGNSSTRQGLEIDFSGWCSNEILDEYTGTTADRLSGEAVVYCNGTSDYIAVKMHNYGGTTNRYRDFTSGYHHCYVNIQYIGNEFSANR